MRCVYLECSTLPTLSAAKDYQTQCFRKSLREGDSPISIFLYLKSGLIDTHEPEEWQQGLKAVFAWIPKVDAIIFYYDHGFTSNIRDTLIYALAYNIPYEFRFADETKPLHDVVDRNELGRLYAEAQKLLIRDPSLRRPSKHKGTYYLKPTLDPDDRSTPHEEIRGPNLGAKRS